MFIKKIIKKIDNYQEAKINQCFKEVLGDLRISFVDIGAAGNIHPRWKVISNFINYYGFEPDKRSYDLLLMNKNDCFTYKIFNKAVWETEGEIDINLCYKPWVSSYFLPNFNILNKFSDKERFEVLKKEKITTTKLDKFKFDNENFIKIDIQGGELSVLRGASSTLKNCLGLELEIEFLELYKSQPLFGEVCRYLNDNDFEFIDFISLNRWERSEYKGFGQSTFGDALFLRTPEFIIKNFKNDEDLKRKYIAICLLYNRFDLVKVVIDLDRINNVSKVSKFSDLEKAYSRIEKKHIIVRFISKYMNKIIRLFDKNSSLHVFY